MSKRSELRFWSTLSLLFCLISPGFVRATPKQVPNSLTNETIVKLTRAHVSEAAILDEIRTRPGNYAVSEKDVAKLKKEGVSDKVIVEMVLRAGDNTGAGATGNRNAPAPGPSPKVSAPQGWSIRKDQDGLTGKPRTLGTISLPFQFGAERVVVEVTSQCGLGAMPSPIRVMRGRPVYWIAFEYSVRSEAGSPIPLRWNAPIVRGANLMGEVVYEGDHAVPWVDLRVKVDADTRLVPYEGNSSDNTVRVEFQAPTVLRSRSVIVELPLQGGRPVAVPVEPIEETFREWAQACFLDREINSAAFALKMELDAESVPSDPLEFLGPVTQDGYIMSATRQPWFDEKGDSQKLQRLLRKYIDQHGLNLRDYRQELEYIVQHAPRCAQIPSEALVSAPMKQVGAHEPIEDLSGLGPEYSICKQPFESQDVTRQVGGHATRHLWVAIYPERYPGRCEEDPAGCYQWKGAQAVGVMAGLNRVDGDPEIKDEKLQKYAYRIVEVSIPTHRVSHGMIRKKPGACGCRTAGLPDSTGGFGWFFTATALLLASRVRRRAGTSAPNHRA